MNLNPVVQEQSLETRDTREACGRASAEGSCWAHEGGEPFMNLKYRVGVIHLTRVPGPRNRG